MKKLFIIIIFVFNYSVVQAQTVSYAPTSIEFWGETKFTTIYSFEYDIIGLHFFNIRKTHMDELGATTVDETFALSLKPVDIKNIVKLGVIAFDRTFPTRNGQWFNLWIEAGLNLYRFRISYVHISNAYTGRLNHGIDFINISFRF